MKISSVFKIYVVNRQFQTERLFTRVMVSKAVNTLSAAPFKLSALTKSIKGFQGKSVSSIFVNKTKVKSPEST
jgi:hypothetical protein